MKISKKIAAVFLSFVLVASFVLPSFAAGSKNQIVPVICVEGFGSKPLTQDANTANEKVVFPPSSDVIKKAMTDMALPTVGLALVRNWNIYADQIMPSIKSIIAPVACNADGTSKYNVTVKFDKTLLAKDADNMYRFDFDWRMDPMDTAKDLNSFIKYIKEQTGSDKVSLLSKSMGGAITMAYLYLYGSDDIEAIVMCSSAFNGVSFAGEQYTRSVTIDKNAILGYADVFIPANTEGDLISLSLSALNAFGVFDQIMPIIAAFTYNLKDRLFTDVFNDTFGTMPGIWALVPPEYYEAAKTVMFGSNPNATLIAKIDRYNYDVKCNVKKILQDAIDKGVRLAITSNYDLSGVPLTSKHDVQTDFLIDTVYTSGGATCAPLGKTLGKNYVQKVNDGHNHISPDNVIDASTCMFPEYTWFIKDLEHLKVNADYFAFADWFFNGNTQYNVFTNTAYPQFLQFNKAANTITPQKYPAAAKTVKSQAAAKALLKTKLRLAQQSIMSKLQQKPGLLK